MSVIDPSTSLGTTLPEELKITLENVLSLPLDSIEDDDSSELDDTTLLQLANDEDNFAELEDSTPELDISDDEDSSEELPLALLLLADDEDDFAELEDSTLELEMTEDSSPETPLLLSSPQAVKTRPVKRTALAQAKKKLYF